MQSRYPIVVIFGLALALMLGCRDSQTTGQTDKSTADANAGTTSSRTPPVLLVPGKSIEEKGVTLHHAIIEMKGHETPARGAGLTMIQRGGLVTAKAQIVHLLADRDDRSAWQYELRPIGDPHLELTIAMENSSILGHVKFGHIVDSVIWQDQPYEIIDREGIVVFAHPKQETIGQKRTVATVPEEAEGQFIAE